MASDPARPESPDAPAARSNVLLGSFVSFFVICLGVWLVTAGKRYREEYSQYVDGFRLGATRMVELTLVASDKRGLACASDKVVEGLRCGHKSDSRAVGAAPDDPTLLQPYFTTSKELLFGAGLWLAPVLEEPLPGGRFTVVCNFHVTGVTRSAAIRFAPDAPFGSIGAVVPVGTLTDCVFP
jgi:hypothetical protein